MDMLYTLEISINMNNNSTDILIQSKTRFPFSINFKAIAYYTVINKIYLDSRFNYNSSFQILNWTIWKNCVSRNSRIICNSILDKLLIEQERDWNELLVCQVIYE